MSIDLPGHEVKHNILTALLRGESEGLIPEITVGDIKTLTILIFDSLNNTIDTLFSDSAREAWADHG